MRSERLYSAVALLALAMAAGPVGSSAFVVGFLFGESPCVLCWAQRAGMALVALTALFIVRYGPRPRYLGMGVLIAVLGIYMGLRHSALHLVRDIGQGFAGEFFGAHTYVWSLVIFWVAALVMGLLLLLTPDGEARGVTRDPGWLGRGAIVVFLVAVAGNAAQALMSTGPPPYMGQSDPVRFSFVPSTWVWSLDEWRPVPFGWRGRYDVETPSLEGLPADPSRGPLAGLEPLPVLRELRIGAPLGGELSDLAYDAAGDRFLATTESHEVLLLDGSLSRVLRRTVLDPYFSLDLGRQVGAAFVDASTLLTLGHNKSWALLEPKDGADARRTFRHFLEGWDAFGERGRGRFATVRARMSYVMSLAYDPAGASFYTASVPSRRYPALVVSRFAREDMTLAEEYRPRLGPGLALSGEKRSLDELYVTGLTFAAGRLYAISASHSTLLAIDPARREVTAARSVPGLVRPTGLCARGDELLVAQADGRIVAVPRP
ncbi:MAG: disulfide bond formation protein B [Vicinamibacteria bacterium]